MCYYLKEIGCNIECKLYPGVGHDYTTEMKDDAFAFLKEYIVTLPPLIINVPLDFSSIQDAIDEARNGDTILVSNGIYKGLGNRNINFNGKEITVKSLNGPNSCIIDCEGKGRGFVFESSENENSLLQACCEAKRSLKLSAR